MDFLRFYLMRSWRHNPFAIGMLLFSLVGTTSAYALLAFWTSRSEAVSEQLLRTQQPRPPKLKGELPKRLDGADLVRMNSAAFTAEFQSIAREMGIPTNEILYVLESSAAQPYLRYRITFDTKADYLELRKFLAALSAEQPHVVLDTIRCRREDAGAASVLCQLAFSAFFQKAGNG